MSLGPGQFDPSSPAGRHLIAHEVAHAIQQRGTSPRAQAKRAVDGASDAAEVQADGFADAFVAGDRNAAATVGLRAGSVAPSIQPVPRRH